MRKRYTNPCLCCGKPVPPIKNKASIYCSQQCYWDYMRSTDAYKRGSIHQHKCHHCGGTANGRPYGKNRQKGKCSKIFCSKLCYDAHRSSIIKARHRDCPNCDASFDPGSSGSKKYCSQECRAEANRAKPSKCVNCHCTFTAIKAMKRKSGLKFASVNGMKTCSAECHNEWIRKNPTRKEKISKAFTAEKHPNWQGGTHRMGGRGPGWQKIAERCRALHGRKCKQCGMTENESVARNWGRLQVNHIIPFHQWSNKRKANAQSNLEALCKSCHTKTDWRWRKENPVQQVMNLFE